VDHDLLDRIDEVTTERCHECDAPLGDSPSEWFCDAECQANWTIHQGEVARLTGYREPLYDPGFEPSVPFPVEPELVPAFSDELYGRPGPRPGPGPVSLGAALHEVAELFGDMASAAADALGRAFDGVAASMGVGPGSNHMHVVIVRPVRFVEYDALPGVLPLTEVEVIELDARAVLVEARRQATAPPAARQVRVVGLGDARRVETPTTGPTVHADPRRNRR
jgi:hypothetical protein